MQATGVKLSIRNVTLQFGGVNALNNVSCDIRENQIQAIIGPNGAGKTCLLMYAGLSSFSLEYSILPVASVVIGGSGNFAGALLGSTMLTFATEALRDLGPLRIALYSMLMVIFALTIREGVFPYIERRYRQFERKVKVI